MKAKSIFCSLAFVIIFSSLTGCAFMKVRQKRYMKCVNAPVLYTDLLKSANSRKYSLPSGEICPGFGGE